MSRSGREWIGTLAGGAAAGLWSLREGFTGPARLLLAVLAGAALSVALMQLLKLARQP